MKTLHWNPEQMTLGDAKAAAETLYQMKKYKDTVIKEMAENDDWKNLALALCQQLDAWKISE